MKDIRGIELKPGDTVCFHCKNKTNSNLLVGTVITREEYNEMINEYFLYKKAGPNCVCVKSDNRGLYSFTKPEHNLCKIE